MSSRLGKYKNKALDTSELRRRREESGIQIRKAKREEQVCTVTSPITFRPSVKDQTGHIFLGIIACLNGLFMAFR